MRPGWDELYASASKFNILAPSKRGTGPRGGKTYTKPSGYAAIPGTGPEGETCRSCKHMVRRRNANVYRKCGLMRPRWTGGSKADYLGEVSRVFALGGKG
ncbi:MAG TPA: hypothetical protein VJQ82_13910 [Terriglobales bacterium]|nr:hypothetical protein [Terriglobales bacterium]